MADVRVNLQAHLLAESDVTDLVGQRVTALMRPQSTDLPAIVFRLTGRSFGMQLDGDSGERSATFELVVWGKSQEECIAVLDVLRNLYHGAPRFALGDMFINECEQTSEYDGDRVLDLYADEGAVAITGVFEFNWDE